MIKKLIRLCVLLSMAIVAFVISSCFVLPVTPTPMTNPFTPSPAPSTTAVPAWCEYEAALAKAALPEGVSGLCEWEILGQQVGELYVWVVCGNGAMMMSAPAAIYFDEEGAIQAVQFPRDGALYA